MTSAEGPVRLSPPLITCARLQTPCRSGHFLTVPKKGMNVSFLVCKDLVVGYGGEAVARGLSLQVSSGDLLCVIGANGAGKSTLVKTLLGLLEPLAGELWFGDGVSKGDVGYLPQRGETQRDFPASVGEIVLSGCLKHLGWRPFYRAKERAVAREALERVGMWDLRSRAFSTLSGGQQQRVLIARALCAASHLLVLDEPMTGLDPVASAELYRTIESLRKEGMGVISVSHDVDVAMEHASHVLVVSECPFFGTVGEWHERMHAKRERKHEKGVLPVGEDNVTLAGPGVDVAASPGPIDANGRHEAPKNKDVRGAGAPHADPVVPIVPDSGDSKEGGANHE